MGTYDSSKLYSYSKRMHIQLLFSPYSQRLLPIQVAYSVCLYWYSIEGQIFLFDLGLLEK